MILLSGQIAKDLNVGDKKIEIDNKNKIFLSLFSNFKDRHLKKYILADTYIEWKNLIKSKLKPIFEKSLKKLSKLVNVCDYINRNYKMFIKVFRKISYYRKVSIIPIWFSPKLRFSPK